VPNIDDAYGEQDHNLENCTVGAQPSGVTMASGSMLPSIRRPAAPRLTTPSCAPARGRRQNFCVEDSAILKGGDRVRFEIERLCRSYSFTRLESSN